MAGKGFNLGACFLACFLLAAFAAAVDLDEVTVDVDDSTLDAGQDLDLMITLESPDETGDFDVEIRILVDDVEVHFDEATLSLVDGEDYEYNISSNNFRDEDNDDVWDGRLMGFACGDHTVTVEVMDGDLDDDFDAEDDYEIDPEDSDNELSFTYSPDPPGFDEDLVVSVLDEDGDEFDDCRCKLTYLDSDGEWDYDDENDEDNCDNDGECQFDLSRHPFDEERGTYQLDVWSERKGYCVVTENIEVSNQLVVTIKPSAVQSGEEFTVCVREEDGGNVYNAAVAVSGPGFHRTYYTAVSGCVAATINTVGTYNLYVTKSGYEDNNLNKITVSEKPALVVSASPTPVEAGKQVTFTVESKGAAVEGATVEVTPQGGVKVTVPGTTNSQGKITYTPTKPGTYTAAATHTDYQEGTVTFRVQNTFTIDTPEGKKAGETASITVADQMGNAVSGAKLDIQPGGVSGTTNSRGTYEFIAQTPGVYTIFASKTGFEDKSVSMTVEGELTVLVDPATVEAGQESQVTVVDQNQVQQIATIEVTKPDKTSETYTDKQITITPQQVGNYLFVAEKPYYESAEGVLTVEPRPLEMSAVIESGVLRVNVSSHGLPVEGVGLEVTKPDNSVEQLSTDGMGYAETLAEDKGNYSIQTTSKLYMKQRMQLTNKGSMGFLLLLIVLLVLLLIMLLIALGVLKGLGSKKGGGLKKPGKNSGKSSFESQGKKSSLGG
ncbi:MAG: DUF4198 domain-containing protein [Candidatus Altiarchaeales archaeon]|nr:DUF4198 domain-containing protein [Candidatus Altiarchaeales archaeon]